MERTGVLSVDKVLRVSRLKGWRKLALEGEDSPLQAATDLLLDGKGLDDEDTITVTGDLGALDDGTAVCFITDAVPVSAAVAGTAGTTALAIALDKSASVTKKGGVKKAGARRAATKKRAAKKGANGGGQSVSKRAAKKGAKKGAAKKGGARKGAAKRSSKRLGRK